MSRHTDTLSGDLFADTPATQHAATLSQADLLQRLDAWAEQGWLRRLDAAFARFLSELEPATSNITLLAAALAAHMEGRGHTCLLLDELLADPATLLGWPATALAEIDGVLHSLPASLAQWQASLNGSNLVAQALGADNAPLLLVGCRLYLRRYFDYERRVASSIRSRTQSLAAVDSTRLRSWLDRLFVTPAAGQHEPDWQKVACAVATRGQLAIITGGPGTGKTYTVARLLALLFATADDADKLRIALAAPTGKAAARLKQSIDKALDGLQQNLGDELPLKTLADRMGAARTLHGLLGARPDTRKLKHHAGNPLDIDVLIVDEASMIHLEMMAALLDALPAHARVILLGDKDQLASVEAGAVMGDLCRDAEAGHYTTDTATFVTAATGETLPAKYIEPGNALAQQTVMLRVSRRFGGPIGQLALAVNSGDITQALTTLQTPVGPDLQWLNRAHPQDIVALALCGREGAPGGYRSYLELVASPQLSDAASHDVWVKQVLTAFDRFRILCALRDGDWGVAGLNRAIEQALAEEKLLRKTGEWYAGRPVMVTRNDYSTNVFNGDIGIALPPPAGQSALRVYFMDGDTVRSVLASRLADVETAFAMTVHKSQGSEFEHTVLVLPVDGGQILTRELVYTGITRARERFTLVTPGQQAFETAVARKTKRASGLAQALVGGEM
ncbi:exodeoxyribonuclease V subunit alpha [Silvimonas sp.]|uniref:exodeoxyribonuclease V subunit alpha n=1 Tax=Silvimonas sp. TaxID=2650811 RepID=UPI00284376A1|nr:exodeoxyribonuclease V subunit alpha [Silvimonas sp.]MDR3426442.1 exodeoxyribonuclease V subunit alpha [Silvimonas sp.]